MSANDVYTCLMRFQTIALALLVSACSTTGPVTRTPSATPGPKYGPNTVPLNRNHEFFSKGAAPDFWSLTAWSVSVRF